MIENDKNLTSKDLFDLILCHTGHEFFIFLTFLKLKWG